MYYVYVCLGQIYPDVVTTIDGHCGLEPGEHPTRSGRLDGTLFRGAETEAGETAGETEDGGGSVYQLFTNIT